MDWIYRLTKNKAYLDPLEEIDALCELSERGEPVFLMLSTASSPPMSGAAPSDVVGLCTSRERSLVLHALAEVGTGEIVSEITGNVAAVYGFPTGRKFLPLSKVSRLKSGLLPTSVLDSDSQAKFLSGQAYAKKLSNQTRRVSSRRIPPSAIVDIEFNALPAIKPIDIASPEAPFTAIGLDPTAGTWDSQMKSGPKEMPSFTLHWDGVKLTVPEDPRVLHKTNDCFFRLVTRRNASIVCIDGPNSTNGLELRDDLAGWEDIVGSLTRDGELALSREGIHLFWTTRNTIRNFDGASRWIARSIVLFSNSDAVEKIETHPHGAFTMLSNAIINGLRLPKKGTQVGQLARFRILNAFIPNLTLEMVPDHDAMDAACASLVGCLHRLKLTRSFGTVEAGGKIWMPDITPLLVNRVQESTVNVD